MFFLLFLFIYWWALAPVVSRLFISEDCVYTGLDLYRSNAYLNFEDGVTFQKMVSGFTGPQKGKAIDFYYVDNHVEDNPIYGKMCDIYSLDFILPVNDYQAEKNMVQSTAETYQSIDDFISYALPYDSTNGEYISVVSFCDDMQLVRYSLITELDTVDGFDHVFGMHANLNWEVSDTD